jgi:hypothetical protein
VRLDLTKHNRNTLAPVLIPPRYEILQVLGPEEEVPDLPFMEQPLRATRNPRVWVMRGEP